MKLPPTQVGNVYSSPDFISDRQKRFFIITNVLPDGKALLATLTTDKGNNVSPEQGIPIYPEPQSIYYDPRENRDGLRHKKGKISFKNYKDDANAVICAEIIPSNSCMYIETACTIVKPDFVNQKIEIEYRTRASESDFFALAEKAKSIKTDTIQIFSQNYA